VQHRRRIHAGFIYEFPRSRRLRDIPLPVPEYGNGIHRPSTICYAGAGNFYNPLIQRALSEIGEQGLSGPGSGQSGNSIDPASGGGGPNVAANAEVGAGVFAGAGLGSFVLSVIWGADVGTGGILTGAAIVATIADALYQIFSDLFGGSDNPPTPRQLRHGRHPLYAGVIGIRTGLLPTEVSATPLGRQPAGARSSGNAPSNQPPLQVEGNGIQLVQFHELENPAADAALSLALHGLVELYMASRDSAEVQRQSECNRAKGGYPGPGVVGPDFTCPSDPFGLPPQCIPTRPLPIPPECR
jgi:hypothetical protein